MNTPKNRLSKILASAGVASRRKAEELIFEGRVTVNGETVTVPQTQVSFDDKIRVDNKLLIQPEEKVYFLLNKPAGYLCSNTRIATKDKLVVDIFAEEEKRLFTAGRLDKDTEGLLVVTNDGHFAQELVHPSRGLQKEYIAKTDKEILPEHLDILRRGCVVEGVFCKPVLVKKVRRGTVKIVVTEGKKHEVRIMIAAAGLECLHLKRVRIGHMSLGSLPLGGYRPLKKTEIEQVWQ